MQSENDLHHSRGAIDMPSRLLANGSYVAFAT